MDGSPSYASSSLLSQPRIHGTRLVRRQAESTSGTASSGTTSTNGTASSSVYSSTSETTYSTSSTSGTGLTSGTGSATAATGSVYSSSTASVSSVPSSHPSHVHVAQTHSIINTARPVSFVTSFQQALLDVSSQSNANSSLFDTVNTINNTGLDGIPGLFHDGDLIALRFNATGNYLSRCPGCITIPPPNITQILIKKTSTDSSISISFDVNFILASMNINDAVAIDASQPLTTEQWQVQFLPDSSPNGNRRIRLSADTGRYLSFSTINANSTVFSGGGFLVDVDQIAGDASTIWEVAIINGSSFALVADGTSNALSTCRNCNLQTSNQDIAAIGSSASSFNGSAFTAKIVQWMDPRLMPPRLAGYNVHVPFANNATVVMLTDAGAITRFLGGVSDQPNAMSVVQLPYMATHAEVWTAAFVGDPSLGKVSFQSFDQRYLRCASANLSCRATADTIHTVDLNSSSAVWQLIPNKADGTWQLQLDSAPGVFLGYCASCSSTALLHMTALGGSTGVTPLKITFHIINDQAKNDFKQSYTLDSTLPSMTYQVDNTVGYQLAANGLSDLYLLVNMANSLTVSAYTERTALAGDKSIIMPHVTGPVFADTAVSIVEGSLLESPPIHHIVFKSKGYGSKPSIVNIFAYNMLALQYYNVLSSYVVYPWSTVYSITPGESGRPMHSVWTMIDATATDWEMTEISKAGNHSIVTFQPKGWKGWYLRYVSQHTHL